MKMKPGELAYHSLDAVIDIQEKTGESMRHLEILTRDEVYRGVTWLLPQRLADPFVRKAKVTVVPVRCTDGEEPLYIVTDLQDLTDQDVFNFIPDRFGRHEGIVFRCRDVVDAIHSPAMRHFVSTVFSLSAVYRYFWTCPASQKHHHSFAGGLALHSVEMAESVMDTPHLSEVERDFGIVYALLHDAGKIWCYREDGAYGDPLGHEMATLDNLHEPLRQLAKEWPDASVAMRSLLSGLWKRSGRKPIMAVGKLVQALDQVSTEQDLRRGQNVVHLPWTPREEQWLPF